METKEINVEKLIAEYNNSHSVVVVGRHFQINPQRVVEILKENGIDIKSIKK